MTHAAVKIATGVPILLCFFVIVIMMTDMLDHRIMIMLTVRAHRRCSYLQGHHGDQDKGKQGSHASKFNSFAH
jgi:hypothetical protein